MITKEDAQEWCRTISKVHNNAEIEASRIEAFDPELARRVRVAGEAFREVQEHIFTHWLE